MGDFSPKVPFCLPLTEFIGVFEIRCLQKRAETRHALKLRTYKYVKEYRQQREELIKNKREARAQGMFSFAVLDDF